MNDLWQHSSVAQGLKEEGRAEGRAEEARELAQIALESRFDTLDEDVLTAIHQAGEPTLKAVIACKTLPEVRARLGLS